MAAVTTTMKCNGVMMTTTKTASLPHPKSRRMKNQQSCPRRPKPQLTQVKMTSMKGKREHWMIMKMMMNFSHVIWKRGVRYARKVDIPIREPPTNIMHIWPASWLGPQGTLGLPETASARLCLPRHTGPWSPGCLSPWAWPITS